MKTDPGLVERSSMSLAKSLRRLMDQRSMTVAELARKSEVPAKTIYHWLSGQQPGKVEHLFRICDALSVSIEELYGRSPRITGKKSLPKDLLLNELNAGIYEVILRPLRKPEELP